MQWRIVSKPQPLPPALPGGYRAWKPRLAEEALAQCVYCCIHESRFGGFRNFHVEHYRPKSLRPDLELNYANLFYACGICNSFKGSDWPAELAAGELDRAGYPDPSQVDYGSFLSVDTVSGEVSSQYETGRYLIERLHLNRAQILVLRCIVGQFSRIELATAAIRELFENNAIPVDQKDNVMRFLLEVAELQLKLVAARPYEPREVR